MTVLVVCAHGHDDIMTAVRACHAPIFSALRTQLLRNRYNIELMCHLVSSFYGKLPCQMKINNKQIYKTRSRFILTLAMTRGGVEQDPAMTRGGVYRSSISDTGWQAPPPPHGLLETDINTMKIP